MTFVLASLLFSGIAFANPTIVKIKNNDPQYSMFVNYQACFRELKHGQQFAECRPRVHSITIRKGKRFVDVLLPEYTDFAKVISAYAMDDSGASKAHTEFPGEEDCKSFDNSPATLETNVDTRSIACTRG